MKRLILSLLAVCLLWMANAQNPAWGPQSKVVTDSIYSQVLKAHRAYTIYLPQSYSNETDRKYPILYLLHGMSGVNTSWFTDQRVKDVMDQLVASGEACEMIIVSPNAGGNPATCWNGYFNMPGWAYEDFFYKEFLPYIEKTYRVKGDKRHRAIAGWRCLRVLSGQGGNRPRFTVFINGNVDKQGFGSFIALANRF